MVKHPDKWRETIDPFTLKINNFEIKQILGYPHAGNDVFHICGIYKDQFKEAFLKVERQKTANIRTVSFMEIATMLIFFGKKGRLVAY